MPTRAHLTPEENEALREVARNLVIRFGSQKRVCELTGYSFMALSKFLSGGNGAGFKFAERLRKLADLPSDAPLTPDLDALAAARSLPTETLLAIVRERMMEGA